MIDDRFGARARLLLLHARRMIAQRALYGVDKNPFTVDLAKRSLRLAGYW